ncbi:MAG: TIM barrel protein [Candidatus Woesearchaeota archaeon]|nr:TIM barrel protein [Candidatus Woesearchaeota archaeon]
MIKLGPAGSPLPSTLEGVEEVKKIGLSAMEVEFTHGVRMKDELAKSIGKAAEKTGISLSVHAPYFINLASDEKEKRENSVKRILDSARLGSIMEATHIVFHAAFYGKMEKSRCYDIVREYVLRMQDEMKENGWNTLLAPETTGKHSQFGTVEELLKLREETGCSMCIDFAHLRARNNGIDYEEVLEKLSGINHIHSHFSGIEYTSAGERSHKIMDEREFLPLAKLLLKNNTDITIISESPITWQDSLRMKKIIEGLR